MLSLGRTNTYHRKTNQRAIARTNMVQGPKGSSISGCAKDTNTKAATSSKPVDEGKQVGGRTIESAEMQPDSTSLLPPNRTHRALALSNTRKAQTRACTSSGEAHANQY